MKKNLLILSFLVLNILISNAQINFVPNKTEGCYPLNIYFENNSLGANSFHWNFDDGTNFYNDNSSLSHVFSSTGTYNVILTAYDTTGSGGDTNMFTLVGTKDTVITVNSFANPTVSAPNDVFSCGGTPINLNGSATNASSVVWSGIYNTLIPAGSVTTLSSGVFADSSSLSTVFTPTSAEIPVLPTSSVTSVKIYLNHPTGYYSLKRSFTTDNYGSN